MALGWYINRVGDGRASIQRVFVLRSMKPVKNIEAKSCSKGGFVTLHQIVYDWLVEFEPVLCPAQSGKNVAGELGREGFESWATHNLSLMWGTDDDGLPVPFGCLRNNFLCTHTESEVASTIRALLRVQEREPAGRTLLCTLYRRDREPNEFMALGLLGFQLTAKGVRPPRHVIVFTANDYTNLVAVPHAQLVKGVERSVLDAPVAVSKMVVACALNQYLRPCMDTKATTWGQSGGPKSSTGGKRGSGWMNREADVDPEFKLDEGAALSEGDDDHVWVRDSGSAVGPVYTDSGEGSLTDAEWKGPWGKPWDAEGLAFLAYSAVSRPGSKNRAAGRGGNGLFDIGDPSGAGLSRNQPSAAGPSRNEPSAAGANLTSATSAAGANLTSATSAAGANPASGPIAAGANHTSGPIAAGASHTSGPIAAGANPTSGPIAAGPSHANGPSAAGVAKTKKAVPCPTDANAPPAALIETVRMVQGALDPRIREILSSLPDINMNTAPGVLAEVGLAVMQALRSHRSEYEVFLNTAHLRDLRPLKRLDGAIDTSRDYTLSRYGCWISGKLEKMRTDRADTLPVVVHTVPEFSLRAFLQQLGPLVETCGHGELYWEVFFEICETLDEPLLILFFIKGVAEQRGRGVLQFLERARNTLSEVIHDYWAFLRYPTTYLQSGCYFDLVTKSYIPFHQTSAFNDLCTLELRLEYMAALKGYSSNGFPPCCACFLARTHVTNHRSYGDFLKRYQELPVVLEWNKRDGVDKYTPRELIMWQYRELLPAIAVKEERAVPPEAPGKEQAVPPEAPGKKQVGPLEPAAKSRRGPSATGVKK